MEDDALSGPCSATTGVQIGDLSGGRERLVKELKEIFRFHGEQSVGFTFQITELNSEHPLSKDFNNGSNLSSV